MRQWREIAVIWREVNAAMRLISFEVRVKARLRAHDCATPACDGIAFTLSFD